MKTWEVPGGNTPDKLGAGEQELSRSLSKITVLIDEPAVCGTLKEVSIKRILALIKEAGYAKLVEGDRVICKAAWDLLSPVIKEGLESQKLIAGWQKVAGVK